MAGKLFSRPHPRWEVIIASPKCPTSHRSAPRSVLSTTEALLSDNRVCWPAVLEEQ
jgi:hypothetical protein